MTNLLFLVNCYIRCDLYCLNFGIYFFVNGNFYQATVGGFQSKFEVVFTFISVINVLNVVIPFNCVWYVPQCHYSYGECGLGSDGTDRLVKLVQKIQHHRSASSENGTLFGAKITGGGSGGSVCVIGRNCLQSSKQILEVKWLIIFPTSQLRNFRLGEKKNPFVHLPLFILVYVNFYAFQTFFILKKNQNHIRLAIILCFGYYFMQTYTFWLGKWGWGWYTCCNVCCF